MRMREIDMDRDMMVMEKVREKSEEAIVSESESELGEHVEK